jgi:ubiquinone/menaquinone biosynthesis C-methylase UbiE
MREYEVSINRQYGVPNLTKNLLTTLRAEGLDLEELSRDELNIFDEFHLKARKATREMAELSGTAQGMKVLDVGCGIGGPARTLAYEFGCIVDGIDLCREYIHAAKALTDLVGLADNVRFKYGNALELPYENVSFELVWLQHVAVNIERKSALLREISRVLTTSGRLAFYEIFSLKPSPLRYPMPWADSEEISFLVTPDKFRSILLSEGFRIDQWQDLTREVIEWGKSVQSSQPTSKPLGIDLVIGPNHIEKTGNLYHALEAGQLTVIRGVCTRD